MPFSEILTRYDHAYYAKQILSQADIDDPHVAATMRKFETQCSDKCQRQDCENKFMNTRTKKIEGSGSDIIFRLMAPREPSFTIQTLAVVELAEYVFFIFGCFGTWYPLAMTDCNPFVYGKNRPGRRRVHRQKTNFCSFCFVTRCMMNGEVIDYQVYDGLKPYSDLAIYGALNKHS